MILRKLIFKSQTINACADEAKKFAFKSSQVITFQLSQQ